MINFLANPARFMSATAWVAPAFGVLAALLFVIGVRDGLFHSPAEQFQGETVRIMYVHVPAAWWSLGVYTFMAGASFVSLVWRHAMADLAARAAAPIGATFAAICLITGSIWGAPTWGTWWEWDGRLTSMLILFLTYLGYLALIAAVDDEERASRLAAILCLAGFVNIPIVHFSVEWWSTLHQPASVLRPGGSSIDASMRGPLFTMAGAYFSLFVALLIAHMRASVHRRRVEAARLRAAGAGP
jgi:heme exporter protein C